MLSWQVPFCWAASPPSGIDGDVGLFVGCGFGELLTDDRDQIVELGFAAVDLARGADQLVFEFSFGVVVGIAQTYDRAPPEDDHLREVTPALNFMPIYFMHFPELAGRSHLQIHQAHHPRPGYRT